MRREITLVLLMLGITTGSSHMPAADKNREDEIVRLERAALDRWGRGDPEGFLGTYAPEITYFDPMQPKRVNGLTTMRKLYGPIAGKVHVDSYDMIEPKVQRYGDMAVLTYNLVSRSRSPDGQPRETRWNSSSVYHRFGRDWRMIHSHWSFTAPAQQSSPAAP